MHDQYRVCKDLRDTEVMVLLQSCSLARRRKRQTENIYMYIHHATVLLAAEGTQQTNKTEKEGDGALLKRRITTHINAEAAAAAATHEQQQVTQVVLCTGVSAHG